MNIENRKYEIVENIKLEMRHLGSYGKVANLCKISKSTISDIVNGKWSNISNEMWLKIATALGMKDVNWVVCENTINFDLMVNHLEMHRKYKMTTVVTSNAGSGKSTGMDHFRKENKHQGVIYYLECDNWNKKELLVRLCDELGVKYHKSNLGSSRESASTLCDMIIAHLKNRRRLIPVILMDQADKLRPAAMNIIIPVFNKLEDQVSIVMSGTRRLRTLIEKGIRNDWEGYDEIESRFGRSYFELLGVPKDDVVKICEANGVSDKKVIQDIWQKLPKERIEIESQTMMVLKDTRCLKRRIIREKLKAELA